MNDVRHATLLMLWIIVVAQSLFVVRFGIEWRGRLYVLRPPFGLGFEWRWPRSSGKWRWPISIGKWRSDFVGRALFFKSCAVLSKAVAELLLWLTVPEVISLLPTWLLVIVVLSDAVLAIGCTWQYIALERQKREDRRDGTNMGQEVDDAPAR